MTESNMPVTEDELHAYVDNELPAERRADVETWLSAHPDDAERVQAWRAMAEALHARYDRVADEPIPKRLEIERLTLRPRRWIIGSIAASLLAPKAILGRMRRPTGFSSGKISRAKVSFTIASGRPPCSSLMVNARPCSRRIPMQSK